MFKRHIKSIFYWNSKQYIPIRPLKNDRNLLYQAEKSVVYPFISKLFVNTPFLIFLFQGILNEITILNGIGIVFSAFLSKIYLDSFKYLEGSCVLEFNVNKCMSKYQFLLLRNKYTQKMQKMLLESQGIQLESFYYQKINAKAYKISQEQLNIFKNSSKQVLSSKVSQFRRKSKFIILEFSSKSIEKLEFVTESQMKQIVFYNYVAQMPGLTSGINQIWRNDITQTKQKQCLMIWLKQRNDFPIRALFIRIVDNIDKKHEEYLKALGEGKRIMLI